MNRVRISEIALESAKKPKEVLDACEALGIPAKSPGSAVTLEQAEKIMEYLISGLGDKTTRSKDIKPMKNSDLKNEIKILSTGAALVNSLKFSPDGRQIVASALGVGLIVWDFSSGEVINRFGPADIASFDFNRSADEIIIATKSGSVSVWNIMDGTMIKSIIPQQTSNPQENIFVSFSKKNFITLGVHDSDGFGATVWKIDGVKELFVKINSFDNPIELKAKSVCAHLSQDSFVAGLNGMGIVIHQNNNNRFIQLEQRHGDIDSLLWGVKNNLIYCISNRHYGVFSKPLFEIFVFDSHSDFIVHKLTGHRGTINSISLSSDENFLASCSNDNTIRIWDIASAKTVRILKGHANAIKAVAFSPCGKYLVSASRDSTLRLWHGVTPVEKNLPKSNTSETIGKAAMISTDALVELQQKIVHHENRINYLEELVEQLYQRLDADLKHENSATAGLVKRESFKDF